jgi:hypothetical protein
LIFAAPVNACCALIMQAQAPKLFLLDRDGVVRICFDVLSMCSSSE